MFDPNSRRGTLTPEEARLCGIVTLVILGVMVAEVVYHYEPVKLSALLVILFWVPLLALHEAGHAVVAAMLGWRVGRVVIGMGQVVRRFRLRSALVEVRVIPVE